MNKSECDQIAEVALNNTISCKVLNMAEVYEVIFDNSSRFKSFEAAKHALKALILEKHHILYEDSDYELPDLFFENVKEETSVEHSKSKDVSLKVDKQEDFWESKTFLVFTTHHNVCKVQNLKFSSLSQIIDYCELDAGERPYYIAGIHHYRGFLLVAFENGKMGKIDLKSFKTETNRKKLKNVVNDESRLVFIECILNDIDLAVMSDIDKVVVFNSSQINAVGSKTTKGVQVMKSKDGSKMIRVRKLADTQLSDPDYYRKAEGLNAVGFYLKEGDSL
jgi:DNA gyrase/topoisomerase IV subunit A